MKLYTFCFGEITEGIIMNKVGDSHAFVIGGNKTSNRVYMSNIEGSRPIWHGHDSQRDRIKVTRGILAKVRTQSKYGESHTTVERMVITAIKNDKDRDGYLIGVCCVGGMSLTDFGSLTTIKGNPVIVMQGRTSDKFGFRRFNEYLVIAQDGDIMRASLSGNGGTYIISANFGEVSVEPIEKCVNVSSEVRLNLGTVMARFPLDGA